MDTNNDTKKKTEKKTSHIHPVDLYVGKRLKERRIALHVSQETLASYVNLTFQQIQKYEKGLNRISCSKLYEFAQFLKIHIGYFFEGMTDVYDTFCEDENDAIQYANDSASSGYTAGPNDGYSKAKEHSEKLDALISYFSYINPAAQESVLELLRNVSGRK